MVTIWGHQASSKEISLTISMPRCFGAIQVNSSETTELVSDEEIEKIGMEIVMQYETSQGRVPEDVSIENLGFDIRLKNKTETRYVEVKARRDEGYVALTCNEWLKAKRFKKQYWLYVVAHAGTSLILYWIQNQAENLSVQEKAKVIRFLVPLTEWKKKEVRAS